MAYELTGLLLLLTEGRRKVSCGGSGRTGDLKLLLGTANYYFNFPTRTQFKASALDCDDSKNNNNNFVHIPHVAVCLEFMYAEPQLNLQWARGFRFPSLRPCLSVCRQENALLGRNIIIGVERSRQPFAQEPGNSFRYMCLTRPLMSL